jgi:hypothetical protein
MGSIAASGSASAGSGIGVRIGDRLLSLPPGGFAARGSGGGLRASGSGGSGGGGSGAGGVTSHKVSGSASSGAAASGDRITHNRQSSSACKTRAAANPDARARKEAVEHAPKGATYVTLQS